ncbi:MAG TPA: hypothetical protein VMI56_25315 [Reyranella sp.]|nr:hypothetical protein [Reyranella sp.]
MKFSSLSPLVALALLAPSATSAQAPDLDKLDKACTAAARAIAAANPPPPPTTQLVATHFARTTTHRCYVLLTQIAAGPPAANIRTLYRGEKRQVLAIASDVGGARSGSVFDPSHVAQGPLQNGYDDALGYIDSKMAFDEVP